ncbi:hypothetical protein [Deinococcus marmoris]|uniref:Uncharacterized protein n=1 Tax=Deinococcus marmoris TaxID=249408 RepID=A0A1U7P4V9_9DEIO|nr:hypothetical protein [Deinococcus marmoris]OLV20204.1 hypothetical protein BOO71_0000640 [Deinococcus marmoris]
MTHTQSLSARIAFLETQAAPLTALNAELKERLQNIERLTIRIQDAVRAQHLLAGLEAHAAQLFGDAAPEALSPDPVLSPTGDAEAPAEVPELTEVITPENVPPEVALPVEAGLELEQPGNKMFIVDYPDAVFDPERGKEVSFRVPRKPSRDETPTAQAAEPEPQKIACPGSDERSGDSHDLPPISTNHDQVLAFIEAHPHSLMREIAQGLPRINPGTVNSQISGMFARGDVVADGSPRRYRLPGVPAPELPADTAAPEQATEIPAATVTAPPPQTVIRDHPPKPQTATPHAPEPRKAAPPPREVNLPRDLPPVPQAAVKATSEEVEIVRGALKNHGRPMSKTMLLNRVIKSGIKSGALDDALVQLVTADQVECTGSGQYVFAARKAAV